MNKIISMFVLLFASINANAGILLDSGSPSFDSDMCVAQGCEGAKKWSVISGFTASSDWNITGFEFFAFDYNSIGTSSYLSTSWKIFADPSTSGTLSSISGLGTLVSEGTTNGSATQSQFTTIYGDIIDVTSFLISGLDLELDSGNYFLVQHHDFSESANFTVAASEENSTFYNTDFAGTFNSNNTGVAQKIFGKVSSIPEPASIALFGMGLLGLGWSRKKKQSK